MTAVVLIQPVIDSSTVKVGRNSAQFFETSPRVMNRADRHALEAALRWRGASRSVAAVSLSDPAEKVQEAAGILKEALAIGADSAYLIAGPGFSGGDPLSVSIALAAAIRHLEAGAVFCGPGQVGIRISEEMGWPLSPRGKASGDPGLADWSDGASIEEIYPASKASVRGRRNEALPVEGATRAPIEERRVFRVQEGSNVPRIPNMIRIAKAARAEIPILDAALLGLSVGRVGSAGAGTFRRRLAAAHEALG